MIKYRPEVDGLRTIAVLGSSLIMTEVARALRLDVPEGF